MATDSTKATKPTTAPYPFVYIYIDAMSFPYANELVQSNTEADMGPRLEALMRTCLKKYSKKRPNVDLESCVLWVDVLIKAENGDCPPAMLRFCEDVTGVHDSKIFLLMDGKRREGVQDEPHEVPNDPMCQFTLLATRRPDQLEVFTRRDSNCMITDELPGYVPVNAAGQRVDENVVQRPADSCFGDYLKHKRRNGRVRSCYHYHLGDGCDGEECQYDHSEITDDVLSVLWFLGQRTRCVYGGACRRVNCFFGHFCHWKDFGGKHPECKLQDGEHGVDQTVHHWEMGRLHHDNMV